MGQTRRDFVKGALVVSGAAAFTSFTPTVVFGEEVLEAEAAFLAPFSHGQGDPIPAKISEAASLTPVAPVDATISADEGAEAFFWPYGGEENPPITVFDVPESSPDYNEYQHMKEYLSANPDNEAEGSGMSPFSTTALAPLPRAGDVIARFALLSDTHSGFWGDLAIAKLNNSLAAFQAISPDMDAVFIIGDLTTYNTKKEITNIFNQVIAPLPTVFTSRTPLHLLMGNHDFMGGWFIAQFEQAYGQALRAYQNPSFTPDATAPLGNVDYGQKQNTTLLINGVPIIKLCPRDYTATGDYRYLYNDLQDKLAAARLVNGDPNKPILVMAHHPVEGLAYREEEDFGQYGLGTPNDLVALLSQYPEVVFLHGHTHNPLQMPTAINQDPGFTVIDTATNGGAFWLRNKAMDHDRHCSQGTLLDVHSDGRVTITRIELGLSKYIGAVWDFYPADAAFQTAPYLIAPRQATAAIANTVQFANLTVQDSGTSLTVEFDQGILFQENEDAFFYRYVIDFSRQGGSIGGESCIQRRHYSDFLAQAMIREHRFELTAVDNGTWTVTVTAYDPFENVKGSLTTTLELNRALNGWVLYPEGKRYYNPITGVMSKVWDKIDNLWYYFSPATGFAQTGWLYYDQGWFYLDPEEYYMHTGWLSYSYGWFYLRGGDSGRMLTGWQKIDGLWYYFKGGDSGRMLTGWQKIDGSWFYLHEGDDGHMHTGWLWIDEAWYYFKEGDSGRMVTGRQSINGVAYNFGSNGALIGTR